MLPAGAGACARLQSGGRQRRPRQRAGGAKPPAAASKPLAISISTGSL
jgi:hypothetical protein